MRRYGPIVLGGFVGCLLIWWAIGEIVMTAGGHDGLAFDEPLTEALVDDRTSWATSAMRTITDLGGAAFLNVLAVAVAIGLFLRRKTASALLVVTSFAGSVILYQSIKALVDRPRPDLTALADFGGSSFPSGHATGAASVFVALALLFRSPRWVAIAAWTLAGVAVVLVGVSRVYLAVHWPTDVLGGWALGVTWAAICAYATAPTASTNRNVVTGTGSASFRG